MGSPAENFVYQFKGMCYFTNGTEHVRLVARQIYNKEEILRFDSDLGEFVAVTELGRVCAEIWNTQKDLLAEFRAYVETLCRHNYKETAGFTVQRRWQPQPRKRQLAQRFQQHTLPARQLSPWRFRGVAGGTQDSPFHLLLRRTSTSQSHREPAVSPHEN